ncbi:transposase [Flavobacterium sp. SM15]|uniref:transposase n=1 Tax=Flavobacterium sp. SM15 TaxID=2908005 RepID=UPI001EDA5408|nr:transposase [Flavobacterium sp. SM15]MCG2612008.1 transposase [Flavobacterium sp. SM15]
MNNRFLCPNCHVEEYYFDGEILKCPRCNQNDFESALHDSEGHIHYQKLIKLKQPFFELVYGKIYSCDVEFDNKLEKINIIPIISDKKTNKVFIMLEDIGSFLNHQENIEPIMTKTFSELWNLEIKNELYHEYDYPIIIAASEKDNSIVSYNGWILKNFIKIN